ncbi:amidohydrolase family protein [Sphingomonas sp. MMS24-JH45]
MCTGTSWGLASQSALDLSDTRSLEEAKAKIAAYAKANPDRRWILGRGWNQEAWGLGRFPTAADLDAVSGGGLRGSSALTDTPAGRTPPRCGGQRHRRNARAGRRADRGRRVRRQCYQADRARRAQAAAQGI